VVAQGALGSFVRGALLAGARAEAIDPLELGGDSLHGALATVAVGQLLVGVVADDERRVASPSPKRTSLTRRLSRTWGYLPGRASATAAIASAAASGRRRSSVNWASPIDTSRRSDATTTSAPSARAAARKSAAR
jgi:hypothetical protein